MLACAVHVPTGIATIAREWGRLAPTAALWLGRAFAAVIVVAGLRAVVAIFSGGAA